MVQQSESNWWCNAFTQTCDEQLADLKAMGNWSTIAVPAEQAWGDAQDRVRTFQEDGETYIRENPTKAVLTALAAGFVLGLVMRK